MEMLGAVSTVVGLVDVIEKRLVEFRVRLDRIRQHPEQYATLVATHERIGAKLKQLHASISERSGEETRNDMQLVQKHVDAAHSELSALREYLDTSSVDHGSQSSSSSGRRQRITSALSKFTAKRRAIQRTTRNEETLSSVQHHLNCAWRVLNEIRLIRIEEGVNALSSVENDVFVSTIVVRPNPENLVLDFESKDENGTAVTCEGKLKQALLGAEGSCIGVIDGKVAGAIGSGGMGKSCAVRALASLDKVRDMFPEGIYEISLGMDAGELTLKKEICNCIESSGGVELAKQIMYERDMQEFIRKTVGWFGDKKVLFIIDDIWENEEITRNLIFSLKGLLGSGGSRMVFTSRSSKMKSISRSAVEFGLRGPFSNTSKKMILENAQMNEADIKVKRNIVGFRALLQLCGGLPVALAVAGQLVREHGSDFDDPFQEVVSAIECRDEEVQKYDVAGYGALSDLLDTAVQFCERRHGEEWERKSGKTFEDIVLSLCVLKKQQFAPVNMLRRLWGLEDNGSSRDLLRILKNVGLVKEEVVHEKYGQTGGIRLHDLVHAHFVSKAGSEKRENFHKLLLRGYMEEGPKATCRAWWQVDEQEDNYLYPNLFNHLYRAGYAMENLALSLDPRWTVKQLRLNGEAQAFNDYVWVLYHLLTLKKEATGSNRDLVTRMAEAMQLINDAITLAAPYITRNEREIWFQLYGRLLQRENDVLSRYLKRFRFHAERPWLRAVGKCVSQAGGSIKRIWTLGKAEFFVLHAWFGQDDLVYVLGKIEHGESEAYEVWRLEDHGESNHKRVWGVTFQQRTIHSFVCDDGSKLGLAMEDGRLEVWNLEKHKRISCEQNVQDATGVGKFSTDGKMYAFACNETNVKIWKTDGENAEEICLLRNRSVVSSVCWSGDGESVAVGCKDGNVVLWDLNSISAKHEFDIGRGNEISTLEWSRDGRLLATSTAMKGMGVWNVSLIREKVALVPVQVFRSQSVCGYLKWSPDGHHLAVATVYKGDVGAPRVVTMWEMGQAPAEVLKAGVVNCAKQVVCVNWSEDGKKLVAVDESRTVWMAQPRSMLTKAKQVISDTEYGEWKAATLCMDGTILAASCERGIRLWRQHGNKEEETMLVSKKVDDKWDGTPKYLVSAGELVVAVSLDMLLAWNIRSRELVSSMHLRVFVSKGALSKDASVFAAAAGYLIVWRIHENVLRQSDARSFSALRGLALSDDGRFLCAMSTDLNSAKVWNVEDFQLRATMVCKRNVRELSFDEQNDVLIEWVMDEGDMADDGVEQFGLWRWRSNRAVAALPLKRRACVVSGSKFFDEQRRCIATFEDYFERWEYSEESGALVMFAEDGRLVTCYLET